MQKLKSKQPKLPPVAVTPEKLPELFPGICVGQMANLRSQGRGPRYYKQGRRIFYRIADVEEWVFQNAYHTADSVRVPR